MTTDVPSLIDPAALHSDIKTPAQYLQGSGLDQDMRTRPDLGEESYRGNGQLTGRKALITGGDSGIGVRLTVDERDGPTLKVERRVAVQQWAAQLVRLQAESEPPDDAASASARRLREEPPTDVESRFAAPGMQIDGARRLMTWRSPVASRREVPARSGI